MHCWWSPVALNQTKLFLSERLQFKTGGGEKAGKQQKGYALAYKLHREGENEPVGFDLILMGIGLVTWGLLEGNATGIVEKYLLKTNRIFLHLRKRTRAKKKERAKEINL